MFVASIVLFVACRSLWLVGIPCRVVSYRVGPCRVGPDCLLHHDRIAFAQKKFFITVCILYIVCWFVGWLVVASDFFLLFFLFLFFVGRGGVCLLIVVFVTCLSVV
jgi:hypothetical protein